MVSVNYQALEEMMKVRDISRHKLAITIGIPVNTLAGSFRRHTRMKIDTLWKIADCISVPAADLIDRNRYPTEEAYQSDLKAVENGRPDHEIMVEDENIIEIIHRLRKLNLLGLRQMLSLIDLVSEVPKYQKSRAEQIADETRLEEEYLQKAHEEDLAELETEIDESALHEEGY